jgi:hypothetical protein
MIKEMKSVGEVDLNHCLRKEFTRYIIERLIDKRQSINLVGEKGTGKTRLLEDIRDCKLAGVKVILVDLKAHVNTYNGLLCEIHRQLGLKEEVPGKLDRLFDGLEKEPVLYLVFLDNYDALLGNPDMDYKGYNVDFFNDLDFIREKDNISLLCTTCKVHNSLPVYIDKKSYRNSWLTLEIENLPALSLDQIPGELARQVRFGARQSLLLTANEISGRGYNNYLLFYDYAIEMHIRFVRFIIDRTYYNDPKIMVNFIKGDEDIFKGISSLPPNFWTGLAIQYGYLVLIFLASYLLFMRKMHPKPENARDFDNIKIEFTSDENSDVKDNTNREEFSQQLENVFFGKCRDLKWKVTMDGKSMLTGKKHDFLFILKPDQIPDEWKIKHLVKFFKRLLNLDDKDLELLYTEVPEETRKEWLNKFYRELEIEKQAVLLISLFMLAKKQVYLCNTFAYYIPGEIRANLYLLMEKIQPAGTMIIDINRMDSKWMFSKLWQRYYYKKEGYFSLPPLKNQ